MIHLKGIVQKVAPSDHSKCINKRELYNTKPKQTGETMQYNQ